MAPQDRTEPTPLDELRAQIAGLVERWRAACVLKRRDEALLRTLPANERLADLIHEQERTFARCANELEMLALPVAAPARAHQEEKPCENGHVWSNQFGDDWTPEKGTPCDCRQRQWGVDDDELARSATRERGDPQPAAAPDAGHRQDRAGTMADAAEMLWVVLANVSGGDWTKQSDDWQEAAARWRDNYFAAMKRESVPPAALPAHQERTEPPTCHGSMRLALQQWKCDVCGSVDELAEYPAPARAHHEETESMTSVPWGKTLMDTAKLRAIIEERDHCKGALASLRAAHQEGTEDVTCEHGTAMDVHCCNCHSGFIFDRHHQCPEV